MKRNNSVDAMLLSAMRVMTILVNMLSSAVLSRSLDLSSYGTYSTGNLIVNLFSNATILGMMDGANYFYHQTQYDREDSINTLFAFQIFIGIGSAVAILLLGPGFTRYFSNPMLQGIYGYLALRPLLNNLYLMLLTLQLSIGKARAVAVRNALLAGAKLGVVMLTSYVTKDVRTIFGAYLGLDLASDLFFYHNFKTKAFPIRPARFRKELLNPIFRFSIPIGIYVMANSFSRDLDKLVIGWFESTEQLAVYTNCATALPFDVVTAAFLTIIIPIMTRLIQQKELERAQSVFRAYLNVGVLTTVVFTAGCIILSKEVILLLYGAQYVRGQFIFILYTLVDLVKFANISLVLTAKGQTKPLMVISLAMLALNALLNVVLYTWMGFVGPAVATVITTCFTTLILLKKSAQIMETRVRRLFDWLVVRRVVCGILVAGVIALGIRHWLVGMGISYFWILVLVGGSFCGGLMLFNWKPICATFHALNVERYDA